MASLLIALGRLLVRIRYRIYLHGLEAVSARGAQGILFLPAHPALTDPLILFTELFEAFHPRALADADRVAIPLVAPLAKRFGTIAMRDPGVHGAAARADVAQAMRQCVDILNAGGNLLLYPAGHLQSQRLENLGGSSAVETLLAGAPGTRVVLVRTRGMWGSSFSRAGGRAPRLLKQLGKSLFWVLANVFILMPRRRVDITFHEPEDFPRTEGRMAQNRYVEAFFNEDAPPALRVPYGFWDREGIQEIPEVARQRDTAKLDDVPPSVREQVLTKLQELSGVAQVSPEADLSRDLGLDSLTRLELAAWIETEFKQPCPNPENLDTVPDVILAAFGTTLAEAKPLAPIDPRWFLPAGMELEVPEGRHLLDVLVRQATRNPHRIILADQTSGVRTFKDIFTAIHVLKPQLAALEGDHVGIMLPASVGATVVYLATLAAGKIPVMVNWTVGARNLQHGLELLEVHHVLTSRLLLQKLASQGVDLGGAVSRLLPLEQLRERIGLLGKVAGALKARWFWRRLADLDLPETAVVLFTSGSESLPKAVPLSHGNLLTNVRDIFAAYRFLPGERMLGCLPPFHSFGLTGNIVMPLVSGMPVVYHPNPTEGPMLARLTEAYGATMLLGTPTFLAGAARAATDAQLNTLRLVITGAEKCPDSLFDGLARRWPRLQVLEGYGITECSPVISGNRIDGIRRGTVGQLLPSVQIRLVHPETHQPVAPGAAGLLLVKGPSVFKGYLRHDGDSPFEILEGESWYRTGDLVRLDETGSLVFEGRLKRFVKLGGEMVSLPAIEEALLAAFSHLAEEELPLAVEATPVDQNPEIVCFTVHAAITREAANAVLREAGFSPLHFVKAVRPIDAIPLLGTGKTDYRALKAMLA